MRIVIKKFGGTSVSGIDNIRLVAKIIEQSWKLGESVVSVVSAMAGVTSQLLQLAADISPDFYSAEENDVVAASGEQVTAGLLALALGELGIRARSWMGWQLPIITNDCYGEAEIISANLDLLYQDLKNGILPIVAGFQGISDTGRITTLGRGGSDITAAMLASELKASVCQIFTDVSGVYNADPLYVTDARRYESVSYEDMLSFSEHGATVLHSKAIKWARTNNVAIQVLSTFVNNDSGTWIKQFATQACGIAKKTILSVNIPSVTPQQAQALYEKCQNASITFFDWNVSVHGLTFLTWAENQRTLQKLLPKEDYKADEMTLITMIGVPLNQSIYPFSTEEIPVARYFRFPKAASIMVENKYAHQTMTYLHKALGLHEAI